MLIMEKTTTKKTVRLVGFFSCDFNFYMNPKKKNFFNKKNNKNLSDLVEPKFYINSRQSFPFHIIFYTSAD